VRAALGIFGLVHWLDRAAALAAARLPPHRRPFSRGWGDRALVEDYIARSAEQSPVDEITPVVRPDRRSGGIAMRDLSFESPEERLPERVRIVRARWIEPVGGADRTAIIHPAWNDETYHTRRRLAGDLLERGIGSVMIQHPFYGDRRREPDIENPIAYASDFALMGRASVLEGRSLARWLVQEGRIAGVTGFSMGGNIAGFVTATVDVPVASAPIAAAYSPGPVFTDGVLSQSINWEALGGHTEETVTALTRFLHAPSILKFPPPDHTAAAVLLAATRDGFVPTGAASAVHRHWPGSKMNWVNAGHASLLWSMRDRMVETIVEAFERFEERYR
jgi:hypothetical protein